MIVNYSMQKIPFHIISGFLGSGKTTFLKRIIEKYADKTKLGIIQNEFAPANIDGEELKKTGKDFKILEIKNGSVFCVCLMGTFTRSLENFIDKYQPEILIIESSGLSDTTSVAEVVSSGTLGDKIYLASNWCIVDAVNFSKTGLQKQRVVHQIRMADEVIINKLDLVNAGIDDLKKEIKSINPFAKINESHFCDIDFEVGNVTMNKVYFSEVNTLARPNINSMVIRSRKKVPKSSLMDFLAEWSPKAFRIKGFVNLTNGNSVAVQCTLGSVEVQVIEKLSQPAELIALTTKFRLKEWNNSFKALI